MFAIIQDINVCREAYKKNIPENSSIRSILHQSHHSWWLMDLILYIYILYMCILWYGEITFLFHRIVYVYCHPHPPIVSINLCRLIVKDCKGIFFHFLISLLLWLCLFLYVCISIWWIEKKFSFLIDFLLNEIQIFFSFLKSRLSSLRCSILRDLRMIEYFFS